MPCPVCKFQGSSVSTMATGNSSHGPEVSRVVCLLVPDWRLSAPPPPQSPPHAFAVQDPVGGSQKSFQHARCPWAVYLLSRHGGYRVGSVQAQCQSPGPCHRIPTGGGRKLCWGLGGRVPGPRASWESVQCAGLAPAGLCLHTRDSSSLCISSMGCFVIRWGYVAWR